jgi:hypothetical protein
MFVPPVGVGTDFDLMLPECVDLTGSTAHDEMSSPARSASPPLVRLRDLLPVLLTSLIAAIAASSSSTTIAILSVRRQKYEAHRRRTRLRYDLVQAAVAAGRQHRSSDWWRLSCPFFDDVIFHEHFRMSRSNLNYLARLLEPGLLVCRLVKRVDPRQAVAMLLMRLGTTESCREIGIKFGRSRSSVCEITERVAAVLVERLQRLIRCPQTYGEWRAVGSRFAAARERSGLRGRIPGVVGAIDCTHVPIWKPSQRDAIAFINRHAVHSYNVQAVCDDRLLFLNVWPGIPGASHDSGIEKRSLFFRLADATIPRRHYILGDSGYRLMRWQLTPYKQMHRGRPLNDEQNFFNYVHSSMRMVIERAFGRVKTRWRKLHKMDMRDQRTCTALISSAFILHNFIEILENQYPDINPRFEQWPPAPRRIDPAVQLPDEEEMVELNAERDGIASYVHTMR